MTSGGDVVVVESEHQRRRVLMLVENLSVPTDRRVWLESRTLVRAGFDVVVICPRGASTDRAPFEIRDGIEIHRFPLTEAEQSRLGYVAEYSRAFWHIVRL